jgi:hypothetical protein
MSRVSRTWISKIDFPPDYVKDSETVSDELIELAADRDETARTMEVRFDETR